MEVILPRFEVQLPKYGRKQLFSGFEMLLRYSPFYFRSLEVILSRLEVILQIYEPKSLFAVFEVVFTALVVLLLEQWRSFYFDLMYGWQDTSKNFFYRLYIVFIGFAVLILKHWRLFCVDWRYNC